MKIIRRTNFDWDYLSDQLIAENVLELFANIIALQLNNTYSSPETSYYFKAVQDDYQLYIAEP